MGAKLELMAIVVMAIVAIMVGGGDDLLCMCSGGKV